MSAVCLHHLVLLCFRKEAMDAVAQRPLSLCVRHTLALIAAGSCRSFWRAGAAGEELLGDVVYKLVKVLSKGDASLFALLCALRKASKLTSILLRQLDAACFPSVTSY